jgi:hypothetical protein
MAKLNIELCPETGICSIIRENGTKVDLMPGEVDSLREAGGNSESARQVLSEADSDFASSLAKEELDQLTARFKKRQPDQP